MDPPSLRQSRVQERRSGEAGKRDCIGSDSLSGPECAGGGELQVGGGDGRV
ncbi:pyridoxal biosynthesis protein PDX1.3-like [Pyrus ussuriensis x Pyrus communis]|uniref:Pyridoxal biosynthesis protein PDX1.3-like n=1 Tax=Pyrus ussuriensis x Pyrus communis TaxID=2448454 RepID=A0A5N5FZE4_9ROSA|nr:pyridoxal biosynthesis protein PDX1.3-like [Pyrus ussuriensis x Pyrus communis]